MRYPEHKPLLKDKMNRFRTTSLFREFYMNSEGSELEPLWSLQDDDPQGKLPSLKRLYMEIGDPTEYEFAMEAFGSWQQWLKIKASKAMQKWVQYWPDELEIKLRSEGIKAVSHEAKEGKNPFAAAKFLAKGEWKSTPSKRGRPSKEEVERELKIAAQVDAEVGEDAERLGLRVLNGSKD